ncbi:MAG: glutathione S-transferase [Gammaproteobacteria bacterium]|nr:glutathione S-transferase [Gammaproteobacteria bacterium]
MLKLYGFTVSNYFNIVKVALLEKGVDFEIVDTFPNQTDEFLGKSAIGKVPCLETEHGFLTEASVILDYLDDIHSEPSLYPTDPWQKAKVRELMKYSELYVELVARRCFPEAFFGGQVSDETREQVKADLQKGVAALRRIAVFSPYIAGEALSYADFCFMFCIGPAVQVGQMMFGMDLLADFPEAQALLALLNEREHVKTVNDDMQKGMQAYLQAVQGK